MGHQGKEQEEGRECKQKREELQQKNKNVTIFKFWKLCLFMVTCRKKVDVVCKLGRRLTLAVEFPPNTGILTKRKDDLAFRRMMSMSLLQNKPLLVSTITWLQVSWGTTFSRGLCDNVQTLRS